jgi:hypothetical protein
MLLEKEKIELMRQAKLIQRRKPWLHSTGPKTLAGKEIFACDPDKGGRRPLMRRLARALRKAATRTLDRSPPLSSG